MKDLRMRESAEEIRKTERQTEEGRAQGRRRGREGTPLDFEPPKFLRGRRLGETIRDIVRRRMGGRMDAGARVSFWFSSLLV